MNSETCIYCGAQLADTDGHCSSCGQSQGPSRRNLAMGSVLRSGVYTIGKVLGAGGFGITYKGAHTTLRRPVAIKELFPENAVRQGSSVTVPLAQKDGFKKEMDGFLAEAQMIASLNSQGIVDVFDVFQENGTMYIAMEYLEGQTLEQRIADTGGIGEDEGLRVADRTCEALSQIHDRNLLHRDIKPANIILHEDGRIVLIDFGSAREFQTSQTSNHTRILTEDYAAPEQYIGQARFGPYTDIFCLSATLYHALAGFPPPKAMARLQDANPDIVFPSRVPVSLQAGLQAGLQMRVDDRPQTVEEFQRILHGNRPTEVAVSQNSQARNVPVPGSATVTRNPKSKELVFPHPYEFRGELYFAPAELATALESNWPEALEDWRRGYVKDWITRNVTGSNYERKITLMLENEMFAGKESQVTGMSRTQEKLHSPAACHERQLYRVLSILNPSKIPAYWGHRISTRSSLKSWAKSAGKSAEKRELLNRFMVHGLLLAHPKKWATDFYVGLLKDVEDFLQLVHSVQGAELPREGDKKWRLVFTYVIDEAAAKERIAAAASNKRAMSIRWFRHIADARPRPGNGNGVTGSLAARAAASEALVDLAVRQANRRNGWLWSLAIGFAVLIMILIAN